MKILIKMTEDQKNIEDIDNELTMYSYISNYLCFEYFVGYEIASLLGYKNPSKTINDNVSKCNQLVFNDYPGVKIPELNPKTVLISRDGAVEILIKTRKRISPDVLYILKKFNIDTTNKKCLTKEQQTLSAIVNTFKTEKFEDQYKIGKYYLDLYFNEHKIVIECDENGHADRKPHKERERMDYANKKLDIDDSHWIRYNPDEQDFDISKVIGQIYRRIDAIKQDKYLKLLEEENNKKQEEIKDEEEPFWELQIEPITGKFTAPPKEYLINKLKTHNISDIAKSYGISTNPIAKWLKQYEINIKDFDKDNFNPPPKEELIEQCKGRSQTEVSKHYGVSNHIVRKWMTKYGLDFKTIKSEKKIATKEELLKLLIDSEYNETEVANKLEISLLNLQKLIKTHNIERIPSKQELERNLHIKSKEDLAEFYKTSRTTLRKWITSYGLEHIRFINTNNNKKIYAISEDNTVKNYQSVGDLLKDLKINKKKFYECVDKNIRFNGFLFKYNT